MMSILFCNFINAINAILVPKHLHNLKNNLILRQDNRKVPIVQIRSKKRVRWVIKHGDLTHTIECSISFYSGKKKVVHNGYTIMNIEDNKECLDVVVFIGDQRMMFMVD